MRAGWRQRRVARLQNLIEARSNPRFALFFIIFLAGVSGFVTSVSLLQMGLTHMGIRYPLALLVAYLVFLFLLWLWLRTREDPSDIADLPLQSGGSGGSSCSEANIPILRPGGGNFGGGGASADFGSGDVAGTVVKSKAEIAEGATETVIAAAGEGCGVVVLVFVGIAAISAVLVWILSMAPIFLAEIVLDAILIATLYKRLRKVDGAYWLQAMVRRTRFSFLVAVCIAGIGGTVLHWYAPEAQTLGYFLFR